MDERDRSYVVCVREDNRHTPTSVLVKCDVCFDSLWCSSHNLLRIPICLGCAMKLPDPKFIVTKEDMDAAIAELKRLRKI